MGTKVDEVCPQDGFSMYKLYYGGRAVRIRFFYMELEYGFKHRRGETGDHMQLEYHEATKRVLVDNLIKNKHGDFGGLALSLRGIMVVA